MYYTFAFLFPKTFQIFGFPAFCLFGVPSEGNSRSTSNMCIKLISTFLF